jgi:hypothetical protein
VAHAAGIVAERGNLLDALEAEELQRPDIDTALSILEKAPDVPPEPGDEIRQETDAGKAAIDDDLYHLQRDPSETDEDYRDRARMLGCDERGYIRLPRRATAECLVPCIICGRAFEDETAGNNQPTARRAGWLQGKRPSKVPPGRTAGYCRGAASSPTVARKNFSELFCQTPWRAARLVLGPSHWL